MKSCEGGIGVRIRFSRPSGAGAGPNPRTAAEHQTLRRRRLRSVKRLQG